MQGLVRHPHQRDRAAKEPWRLRHPLLQHASNLVQVPRPKQPERPFRSETIGASDFRNLLGTQVWQEKWADTYRPTFKFLQAATADDRIAEWAIVWHASK